MPIYIRKLEESREIREDRNIDITPMIEREWKHINNILIDDQISKPYNKMDELIERGKEIKTLVCSCED